MKTKDWLVLVGVMLFFLPFFMSPGLYRFYETFNAEHGMITSFIKFALLATFGETLGLRIRTGKYHRKGFGFLPRAIVWGFLGLGIKFAFVLFSSGVPVFLSYLGLEGAQKALTGPLTGIKILTAASSSIAMNLIFAPVMMTFHKITDAHIDATGGTIRGLFSPLPLGEILSSLDWKTHWSFVLKKTIPLFWIPAHTVTFLLPQEIQVLFAALLSIILGFFLALASKKRDR